MRIFRTCNFCKVVVTYLCQKLLVEVFWFFVGLEYGFSKMISYIGLGLQLAMVEGGR